MKVLCLHGYLLPLRCSRIPHIVWSWVCGMIGYLMRAEGGSMSHDEHVTSIKTGQNRKHRQIRQSGVHVAGARLAWTLLSALSDLSFSGFLLAHPNGFIPRLRSQKNSHNRHFFNIIRPGRLHVSTSLVLRFSSPVLDLLKL